MLRSVIGAYVVGACFEFFSTFFILVFLTFRPGIWATPGIKETLAALAAFAVFAFAAAVIWPGICPTLVALIYGDLRAQERTESGQERRQNDGD